MLAAVAMAARSERERQVQVPVMAAHAGCVACASAA